MTLLSYFVVSIEIMWYTWGLKATDYDPLAQDFCVYDKDGNCVLKINKTLLETLIKNKLEIIAEINGDKESINLLQKEEKHI